MMRRGKFSGLLVAVALVTSALATGSEARDIKIVRKATVASLPAAPVVAVVRDVTPKAQAAKAQAAIPAVEAPACARKVKVIYAGYGEAERVNCTLASADTVSASGLRTETR